MEKGYILLARKIINSPIMNKPPEYFKTWVYLLLKARFADNGNLKRGEGFASINEIAEHLSYYAGYRKIKPSKKKVWGIIEFLRNPYEGNNGGNSEGTMIVTTKVTHGFVYKVLNYGVYQDPDFYEGNNEGNNEILTKELRRERKGNNKYKNVYKKEEERINNEQNSDDSSLDEKNLKQTSFTNKSAKQKGTATKKNITAEVEELFERLWKLYPCKKGKSKVSKKTKKEMFDLGFDEMQKRINRYISDKEDWKKWQHGSTFFNGGHDDYSDENYEPEPQIGIPTGSGGWQL